MTWDEEKQSRIRYIAQECGVTEEIARIALDYAKGSISIAIDYLSNEHCRFTFGREVKEFELE